MLGLQPGLFFMLLKFDLLRSVFSFLFSSSIYRDSNVVVMNKTRGHVTD